MRLLLDVHIGLTLATALENLGHDVVRAGARYHDWSDERLLALAQSDGRVVITEDGDFGDLVFVERHGPPPAILFLRAPAKDLPTLVEPVLQVLESGRFWHHIVVITPSGTRYRPFPGMSSDNE